MSDFIKSKEPTLCLNYPVCPCSPCFSSTWNESSLFNPSLRVSYLLNVKFKLPCDYYRCFLTIVFLIYFEASLFLATSFINILSKHTCFKWVMSRFLSRIIVLNYYGMAAWSKECCGNYLIGLLLIMTGILNEKIVWPSLLSLRIISPPISLQIVWLQVNPIPILLS